MTRKELLKAKKKSDVIDRYGYDRNGFDRYGYDLNGLDREGYDRSGFDRDGKHVRIYGVVLTMEEYHRWLALPE
jgi:hypothetical protein